LLSSTAYRETVGKAAPGIKDAVEEQFVGGIDSYGKKWKPKVSGAPSRLVKTGELSESVIVTPLPNGIAVTVEDFKATFHQGGTTRMVARPILPTKTRTPPQWKQSIQEALHDAVREGMA
jgi:hypothetical protein